MTVKADQQVKKFDCLFPGCGKSFKRRDYLQRHESNHAKIKPYSCEICRVSFARKDLLEKHQRSKSHQTAAAGNKNTFINSTAVEVPPPKRQKLISVGSNSSNDFFEFSGSDLKFSNVSHPVKDSFGWLFGNDPNYISEPFYTDTANNTAAATPKNEFHYNDYSIQDVNVDYGLYQELSQKLIDYLKNELQVEDDDDNIENLFSKSSMTFFLDQYWKHFNCVYPIIHRATAFDLTVKESLADLHLILLASMITIGMLYSPSKGKDSIEHTIAVNIQKELRIQLYQALNSFEYTVESIPLNLLQSLLLNDIFHMYFGDTVQLSRYNIYHSVVVNLFKEFKLFDNLTEPPVTFDNPQEKRTETWLKWVSYETLKRLAFFSYVLDAQGSFFYGLRPSISVFDIQLELPYTDDVWNADDVNSFFHSYNMLPRSLITRTVCPDANDIQKRYEIFEEDVYSNGNLIPSVKPEGRWPNFLFSLRHLMQPISKDNEDNLEYHFNCFSQFSRFVFLHGVLSLVNELRTSTNIVVSEINDPAVSSNRLNMIAARIEGAFFGWKAYFHNNIAEANAVSLARHSFGPILNVYDTSPVFWANITLLNVGLLGLYCNFGLIVQFSKLIIADTHQQEVTAYLSPGKVKFDAITNTKYKMLVRSWSKSKDGEYSMDQACSLLRMVLSNEEIITSVPHLPYSIFLATLICWAHGFNTYEHMGASTSINLKKDAFKFLNMFLKSDMEEGFETFDEREAPDLLRSLIKHVLKTLVKYSQWTAHDSAIFKDLSVLAELEF